jgi:hypothetical protein
MLKREWMCKSRRIAAGRAAVDSGKVIATQPEDE